MIKLYGIPNCDTVKKARRWLDNQQLPYEFIDYRQHPLSEAELQSALNALGYQKLLNNRSTTFRQLSEEEKSNLDNTKAIQLLKQYPTLIKRPLLHFADGYMVGFSEASYQQLQEQSA